MLLHKLDSRDTRLWYAAQAVEHGWSRNILALQIDSGLHHRQGRAVANFTATLPPAQSDLAQQLTKDPYLFDFLTLTDDANERSVELGLINHVEKFLLELSAGFALVGRHAVISSDDAMAVWRRAAELQAEAASRLESRMRDTAATAPDTALTDVYRLRDVEAAAAEVGISQRHVALALAELRAPDAIQRAQPLSPFMERLATRLFGTTQRTLSVSRVFRFSSKVVLQAVGRTLHAPPYSLVLRDTLGGHPLDGGVLVFDLPRMTDGNYRWTWTRYGVYVPEVRVTFASVPNDPRACEVSMHLDLRRGLTANIAGFSVGTVATSGVSAMFGALIGVKGLALAGAALLGPAFGAAVLVGGACIAGSGKLYRWELVKTTAELEAALAAVEAAIRAMDIFGDTRSNVLNPCLPGR